MFAYIISHFHQDLIEITNQVNMHFEDLNNFPIEIINNTIDSDVYIQSNTGK